MNNTVPLGVAILASTYVCIGLSVDRRSHPYSTHHLSSISRSIHFSSHPFICPSIHPSLNPQVSPTVSGGGGPYLCEAADMLPYNTMVCSVGCPLGGSTKVIPSLSSIHTYVLKVVVVHKDHCLLLGTTSFTILRSWRPLKVCGALY